MPSNHVKPLQEEARSELESKKLELEASVLALVLTPLVRALRRMTGMGVQHVSGCLVCSQDKSWCNRPR